jgi:PAS domain S-box-containing protein/putative nucleotidyltransferase with HDIG domain
MAVERRAQNKMTAPLKVLVGATLSLLACGAQLLLWDSVLSPYVWFLFFPTIFLSGWLSGAIGAFASTIMNAFLVQYFFIAPRYTFFPIGKASTAVTFTYLMMGALVAWFFEKLNEAQKLTGARLNESEGRFEATFDQAAVGIAIVAPDGRWLRVNHRLCAILGYSQEELLETNFQSLTHPDDLGSDLENMNRMLAHEISTYTMEKKYIRKDGEVLRAKLTVSMVSDDNGDPSYFIGVVEDIRDLKEKEARVLRLNRALGLRAECNQIIARATDEEELLNLICREIVDSAGYRSAWIGYVEHGASRSVRVAAKSGLGADDLTEATIDWSEDDLDGLGPFGKAILTGEAQLNWSPQADEKRSPWRDAAIASGVNWACAFPLTIDGKVSGALSIYSAATNPVSAEECALLQELAVDLAFAISVQRTRSDQKETAAKLERSLISGLEAIAYTLEIRDPYTAGHQQRVALLASALARKLGLDEFEVEGIRLAASVHDIGKIQVPLEILTKPKRLTRIEYDFIKSHAEAGYEILKGIQFPWPIAELVRQHHERIDGSGYPQGLRGDDILLGARILAVADVVESMVSHRPYRPALGVEAALAELEQGKGKKYDTTVADKCIQLFAENFAFAR